MIEIAISTIVTILITYYICKSINAGFDSKENSLIEKEKQIYEEVENLKNERKSSKRELTNVKEQFKNFYSEQTEKKKKEVHTIEDWLLENTGVDVHKLSVAKEYAKSKNMHLLSALLTLNIISVDQYELAKKIEPTLS
ncbi:hypothetical protein [Maridesulfovibrio bastinii]|uniref:hypothetical protein n=1 Tax=Maridesulfovibrio bastinii TaxID=47157 RepID=UPI000404BA6C|nr:hypothetical protein [Maridesulfovibrio bastinii]